VPCGQHTSASLTIQENADPDVVHDLNTFFNRLVLASGGDLQAVGGYLHGVPQVGQTIASCGLSCLAKL
jgi:thiamine phosphate synthase YjbQ (UPF0047 family)